MSKNVAHSVEVICTIKAPVDVVFDTFTDHLKWNTWANQGRITLERDGYPDKNGVGCVKVTETAAGETAEEITSFDRNERITYHIIRGGYWIMDHQCEVLFDRDVDTGGTRVTWRCRFNSLLPGLGWHFEHRITQDYNEVLKALESHLLDPPLREITEPCEIDNVSFELVPRMSQP